jgi:hypothetical protein
MIVSDVYKAVTDFCKLAIDDDSVKIIIANQSKERPQKPFVSVALDNLSVAYEHDKEIKDEKCIHHLQSVADITIKCFADGIQKSTDILHKVRKAFYTDLTYDAFQDTFALSRVLKEVSVIPTLFADKVEEVALLEFRMNCYDSIIYSPDFIEHVGLEVKIDELTFNVRT